MKICSECSAMGFPQSSRNCFGIDAPMRFPTPPARRITDTDGAVVDADDDDAAAFPEDVDEVRDNS